MHLKQAGWGLIMMLACINGAEAAPPPSVNVSYRGNLVAEPCILSPEDENIVVNFGTVIDTYLYLNTRTKSKPFQLRLIDCDISLGNTLKITFAGTENVRLPGLLSPDGSSEAEGIAIGLETEEGGRLPLNIPSRAQVITNGNNIIHLSAYVMGEPEALSNRKIKRGSFNAVATFSLEYE